MNKTIVVALFGAAGAGKDALQKEILKQSPYLCHGIISTTTRPPRENETDGVDYFFISEIEAQNKLEDNDYLEYSEFRGWKYGTLKSSLCSGQINVGVFNVAGVKSLFSLPSKDYLILPIRILCNDKTRLQRQLDREQYPDCHEICRRFMADEQDLSPKNLTFPYFDLLNDGYCLQEAGAKALKIIYEGLLSNTLFGQN